MIKFIAADMDGTLLNSQKELPSDLGQVIQRLWDQGIVFAPASGRQYYNLEKQFSPISPDFMYIAENGAMVMHQGKELVCDNMDEQVVMKAIEVVRQIPTANMLVSCSDCAYSENGEDEVFRRNAVMYYERYEVVPDLMEVCREKKILKAAIYDCEDAHKNVYDKLNLPPQVQKILSAKNWLDLMKTGVHKGRAIAHIQEIRGWKPEECMCFGDYLNDYEMFDVCQESYAMANGHDKLKKAARYLAPSNDQDGVMRVIREKILGELPNESKN